MKLWSHKISPWRLPWLILNTLLKTWTLLTGIWAICLLPMGAMSTVLQLLAIKFQQQATCISRMAMGAVTRSWSTVQTRTWESPNATLRRSTTCQKRKYGIKKYLRGRSSAQNKTQNDTYKRPFKTNVLAKNTCTLSNTTLPKTGIKLSHILMTYFSNISILSKPFLQ